MTDNEQSTRSSKNRELKKRAEKKFTYLMEEILLDVSIGCMPGRTIAADSWTAVNPCANIPCNCSPAPS
ncbi:hypothetical protein Y032_0208g2067 [Ancylostoma ceylanicum]|uniref:Uncharacterized protein n=1 Tax=Ancylostoma ceylanicum TaxID=53326 RepID=A0A016SKL1_9BILA|nr:hypothetical protein Y032_0208g2067 [Ancylostoma ceylanicum]